MVHLILALTLTLLSLLPVNTGGALTEATADSVAVDALVKANTHFALDLYHKLSTPGENLFYSPYSISAALGMATAGARGSTLREMSGALHFDNEFNPHTSFRELDRNVLSSAAQSGQPLQMANGLCMTGGHLDEGYRSLLESVYRAQFFNGGSRRINDWVRKRTGGKIVKLVDALPSNNVCMLLNAIYFKGSWECRFNPARTRVAVFHVSPGRQVRHPMMQQRGRFRILQNSSLQVISLPYQNDRLSMVVLLPKERHGLHAIEKEFTAEWLSQVLQKLDASPLRTIDLYFPRYRLETDYDLVSACRQLGMLEACTPEKADFGGMGWAAGDLWIGQIRHKAYVDVTEEGTEAAAATGIGMQTKSARRYPVFRADHPFIFLIRDNTTKSILFAGRLHDPTDH
ncbi:hypothetical protein KQI65_03025 [bacterium]|nr:hypothetical protein [bacterium]